MKREIKYKAMPKEFTPSKEAMEISRILDLKFVSFVKRIIDKFLPEGINNKVDYITALAIIDAINDNKSWVCNQIEDGYELKTSDNFVNILLERIDKYLTNCSEIPNSSLIK